MLKDINDIEAGMILAEDIVLPNGAILVNASQVVTDSLIEALRKREIKHVQVLPRGVAAEDLEFEEIDETGEEGDGQAIDSGTGEELDPAMEAQQALATPPHVEVLVAEDLMTAKVRIEATGEVNGPLTAQDIIDALVEKDVKFGLNEKNIHRAVADWPKADGIIESEEIAKGTPPTPAKEGDLQTRISLLQDATRCNEVRNATYYWEIAEMGAGLNRVDPGTVIAERLDDSLSVPGTDIAGNPLFTEDVIRKKIDLDPSVGLSEDGRQMIARESGVAYYANNVIGVLPLNFDGTAELQTSQDMMEASIIIHRAGPGGAVPTEKEIRALLYDGNVVFGIREDAISSLVENMCKEEYPEEPVVVAVGLPPQNGEQGRVEFLFSSETSLKPKTNPDGSVDFKSLDLVNSVAEGDELARLIPPREGAPGKNVTGQALPCENGTPATFPLGDNTGLHPEKEDVMIATTDGNVRVEGNVVSIQEGYVVGGDIDFSTGNVKYAKSVVVGGDVKSGFTVECGGDLQVSGIIEDAVLRVGGNVLCRLGFIGQGKGIIECKGDANIGFMKNQTIRSRGSVNVAKEALNATIYARKNIEVYGQPLSVAGGTFVARDSITVRTAGNRSGIKTMLEVGVDFTLTEELQKSEQQLEQTIENRSKLLRSMEKFERLLKIKKKLPPKEEFLYRKIKNSVGKYGTQVKALEERIASVKGKVHDFDKAFIKIEHAAMPGTVFKIGERQYLVREEVIGPKSVRLINYEIRIL